MIAIYFAGAAVLLARLGIGTVRVRLLAREATVVNGMLTSARIATPFTFGLLRPRILLPEGWDRWSAAQLAVVLDHERAHMARRDPLVQWLALLNRAVFWFHPLAWWLERHLAALAEEACDAAVLARGHSRSGLLGASARPRAHGGPSADAKLGRDADAGQRAPDSHREDSRRRHRAARLALGRGRRSCARNARRGRARHGHARARDSHARGETAARETCSRSTSSRSRTIRSCARPRPRIARSPLRRRKHPTPPPRRRLTTRPRGRQLLIRVAEPYFDVFAAENALALQEAAREAFSRQREQAERRFEVGLIGITDVMEMQGRFRSGGCECADGAARARRSAGGPARRRR